MPTNSIKPQLADMGWNDFFAGNLPTLATDETVARVIGLRRNIYTLWSPEGTFPAALAGRFLQKGKQKQAKPALGDWVVVRILFNEGEVVIEQVLSRQTQFSRIAASAHENKREEQIIAANIDYVFIVTALDDDFSLRRLERYIAATHSSGAKPVIILNKQDKCPNPDEKMSEVHSIAPDVAVHLISAEQKAGIAALNPYLEKGKTITLIGSSGVGKSTLVNVLTGEKKAATGEIRDADSKGRHTTTWRELFILPSGALLIDNPGIREIAGWHNDVSEAFSDIVALAKKCQYRSCTHSNEKGCALQAALETGKLNPERFANYLAMQNEAKKLEPWITEQQEQRNTGGKRKKRIKTAKKRKRKK